VKVLRIFMLLKEFLGKFKLGLTALLTAHDFTHRVNIKLSSQRRGE
jgi:hypothetical protein